MRSKFQVSMRDIIYLSDYQVKQINNLFYAHGGKNLAQLLRNNQMLKERNEFVILEVSNIVRNMLVTMDTHQRKNVHVAFKPETNAKAWDFFSFLV